MSDAVDKAYRMLRDRIVGGELVAGDRLKERELCAELEVSRTPVREALRRLQSEGLVDIEPRRGGVVAGIRADEIDEVYSLGILLESHAARLAAERATADDLAALDALLGAMRAALESDPPDRGEYLQLDSRFHRRILEMTRNRRLDSIVGQVVGVPTLVQAFNHYTAAHLAQSLQQHANIVAALRAGDADWAEAAMRAHIHSAKELMLAASGIQNRSEVAI